MRPAPRAAIIGFGRTVVEEQGESIKRQVAELYRTDSRRVLATLIRLLGDFDLAEDALQEAFRTAIEQRPREGVPRNPRAWLVATGRFKGVDAIRRRALELARQEPERRFLSRKIEELSR